MEPTNVNEFIDRLTYDPSVRTSVLKALFPDAGGCPQTVTTISVGMPPLIAVRCVPTKETKGGYIRIINLNHVKEVLVLNTRDEDPDDREHKAKTVFVMIGEAELEDGQGETGDHKIYCTEGIQTIKKMIQGFVGAKFFLPGDDIPELKDFTPPKPRNQDFNFLHSEEGSEKVSAEFRPRSNNNTSIAGRHAHNRGRR